MLQNNLFIKFANQDEFNIVDKLTNVSYLGGQSTPAFKNTYQDITAKDGSMLTSVNFGTLIFTANFFLRSNSYNEQRLLRHEIYSLFGSRELFRLRTDLDKGKVMFARPTTFEVNFIGDGDNNSLFSIAFEIPSGYKYSSKRSNEIEIDDISFGMNMLSDESVNYTSSDFSFKIYNASDIAIDPYYQKHTLDIMFSFNGPNYTITNNTNKTSYSYNASSQGNDNIILNGLNTLTNDEPNSKVTDFGFLKLEKGWNDISVTGAQGHTTTFSFPFIYID